MGNRFILQEHVPYSDMVTCALDLCESMLSHSCTLYPFAVIKVDNYLQCIFVPNTDQLAKPHMIEDLQAQLELEQEGVKDSANLIVYAANVTQSNDTQTDALVFAINDSEGQNTVTIYPYRHLASGIKIEKPYTCNFPD